MKQQGKSWITAEGKETLAKYLPKHERLFEKVGQKIAAEATDIEKRLVETKRLLIDLCKEAFRNNPDQGATRRFTFYTFDKEFKVEFDIKEEYVRVYRSTKSNPSSKDYELIIMDFNKAPIEKGIQLEEKKDSELHIAPEIPMPEFPEENKVTESQTSFFEEPVNKEEDTDYGRPDSIERAEMQHRAQQLK